MTGRPAGHPLTRPAGAPNPGLSFLRRKPHRFADPTGTSWRVPDVSNLHRKRFQRCSKNHTVARGRFFAVVSPPDRRKLTAMTQNASLEDLIEATARGDRAAFRALYDAGSAKLFGLCIRICRERPVAEDAMQEAFVDIWRKAAEFDPARGRAGAWMAVIARNRAIDILRRRGRAPGWGAGGDAEAGDPLAALADPTAREDGGAEAMALSECLSRVEEKTRSMLVLAYVEGFSREELSSKFDAPVNTVKTWLRRGLASLKTCLDG